MVLEADAGGAESNSYATVAEFFAVAETKPDTASAAALLLDEEVVAQMLITATSDIDTLEDDPGFVGERYTDEQALAFPRDEEELPAKLVKATIELALYYARRHAADSSVDLLNQNHTDGQLKRKKTDVLEKEWFAPRTASATALERLPDVVQRLLSGLLVRQSAAVWGSASVERSS